MWGRLQSARGFSPASAYDFFLTTPVRFITREVIRQLQLCPFTMTL